MKPSKTLLLTSLLCLASSGFAWAQGPGGPMGGGDDRPPVERAFHDGQFPRWWNDPHVAQQIGLSDDQKHRMDDIFLQNKLKLVDLHANLQKLEIEMRPMIEADQPDETRILAQIDAIAQARAELEKADARMLFDIRKTLTPEQWQKFKAMRQQRHEAGMRRGGPDGPGGPGGWRHDRPGAPPPDGAGGPPAPAPQGQSPAPPQP